MGDFCSTVQPEIQTFSLGMVGTGTKGVGLLSLTPGDGFILRMPMAQDVDFEKVAREAAETIERARR
jgi:hypothetical protein